MNRKRIGAVAGAAALLLAGGIVAGPASADPPSWSHRDSQDDKNTQNNKNLMRNLGIGLGAAAAYELVTGKGTNALLLGAGAALAGSQYEKDRKQQAQDNNWRRDDYRNVNDYRNGGDRRDGGSDRWDRDRKGDRDGRQDRDGHRR
jgi:hypothetical protein